MSEIIVLTKNEIEDLVKNVIAETIASIGTLKAEAPVSTYMDLQETSTFLKLARQTIYGMIGKRLIPHYKRGRKLYFNRDELILWICEGRKKTQAEILKEIEEGSWKGSRKRS